MNLLLLCHGGFKEFSSFDLGKRQSIQYRGNLGSNLSEEAAKVLVRALLDNPYVDEEHLRRELPNYSQPEELAGPRTGVPNLHLSGDDWLPCFAVNMSTGTWIRLYAGWKTTLADVVAEMNGQPCWINLLCCTNIKGAGVVAAKVKLMTEAKDWNQFMR